MGQIITSLEDRVYYNHMMEKYPLIPLEKMIAREFERADFHLQQSDTQGEVRKTRGTDSWPPTHFFAWKNIKNSESSRGSRCSRFCPTGFPNHR